MDLAKFVGYVGYYAGQLTDVVQLAISILILMILLRLYQFSKETLTTKNKKSDNEPPRS